MELFNSLNLISFLACFYIFASIFIISKKTEAGKLFLFFCFNITLWNLFTTIININGIVSIEGKSLPIFIQELFIIITPYAFFLFIKNSLGKNLKRIDLFGIVSLISLFLWLISGKVNFQTFDAYNGTIILTSDYYSAFSAIYINIMYICSFYLIFDHYKKTENNLIKQKYKKCFNILTIIYILAIFSDLILPYFLNIKTIAPITNILMTIAIMVFYNVIIKKSLIYTGITKISKTIFSEIKEGLIIIDKNYKLLYINEFAGFLFNISPNKVNNCSLDQIIPSILLKSEKESFEFITKENKILKVNFTKEFINGIFSGYLLMLNDITDIKNKINDLEKTKEKQHKKLFRIKKRIDILNDQINENYEKYKKIIDINHFALITIDQKTDLIETYNEKAKDFFNISEKNIKTKKFKSFIETPEYLNINKTESFHNITIKIHDKKKNIDLKINHFKISNLNKSILIIKDLTDINRQKKELLRINRSNAVGIIASAIANDFNKLNNKIKNDLMELEKKTLPNDIYNMIIKIERALERSNKITEDLLRFIDLGEKKKESVDITDLIYNVLDLMIKKIERENIKIIKEIEDFSFNVFPSDMRQLLIILIENAIHASFGKIERYIKINTYKRDEKKYIVITDNGYGISSVNINEIFTPFFSTKGEHAKIASPLSKIKGIGLGLTVAEIICKENNINIDVESIPDIKTSFILSFK